MKDISYICCSKNDNYDKDNLDKVILTVNNNALQLMDRGLHVETILVDWCSVEPFYLNERIKKECIVPITHVYVDTSVLIKDGLDTNKFYEFFAKNVGVRQSSGKYVLIENSDIINDEELAHSIGLFVRGKSSNVYGRPRLRVNVWYPKIDEYTHYDIIDDKPMGDLNPGDFMLTTKEDWIRIEGYDETNSCHRGKFRQTNMDVEILHQMVARGMTVHYLDGYYRHMDHDRGNLTHTDKFGNSQRNIGGYKNRETWGYTNAKVEENNGVRVLTAS